jgi:hypothetical protein
VFCRQRRKKIDIFKTEAFYVSEIYGLALITDENFLLNIKFCIILRWIWILKGKTYEVEVRILFALIWIKINFPELSEIKMIEHFSNIFLQLFIVRKFQKT